MAWLMSSCLVRTLAAAYRDCVAWPGRAVCVLGVFLPLWTLLVSELMAEDQTAAPVTAISIPRLDRTTAVDFTQEILPLLQRSCLACHHAQDPSGELNLETPAAMLQGGSTGPAIHLEQPAESLLLQLASRQQEPFMPPDDERVQAIPFSAEELALIQLWIEQGAKTTAAGPTVRQKLRPLPPRLRAVHAVAIDGQGHAVAAGRANRLSVYYPGLSDQAQPLVDAELAPAAQSDAIQSLAFHPTEPLLVAAGFQEATIWAPQLVSESPQAQLPEGWSPLAFRKGEPLVSLAQQQGTQALAVWRMAAEGTPIAIPNLTGVIRGAWFLPGSSRLLVQAAERGFCLVDYTQSENATVQPLELTTTDPSWVAIHPAQDQAVLAMGDGTVYILKGEAGQAIEVRPLKLEAGITALAAAEQGFALGTQAGNVQVWPWDGSAASLNVAQGATVVALQLTTAGTVVADTNGMLKFWRPDGKLAHEIAPFAPNRQPLELAARSEAIQTYVLNYRNSQVEAANQEIKTAETLLGVVKPKWMAAQQAAMQKQTELQTAEGQQAAAKAAFTTAEQAQPVDPAQLDAAKQALAAAEAQLKTATEQLATAKTAEQKGAAEVQNAEQDLARGQTRLTETAQAKQLAEQALSSASQHKQAQEKVLADVKVQLVAGDLILLTQGDWVLAVHRSGQVRGYPIPALWSELPWPKAGLLRHLPAVAAPGEATSGNASWSNAPQNASDSDGLARWQKTPQGWQLHTASFPGVWQPIAKLGGTEIAWFADRVTALAFNPQGDLLALGSGEPSRSGQVVLVDVATRQVMQTLATAHSDWIMGLAFSADGKYLASGGADRLLKVWEVSTGTLVKTFEGHTHHVNTVAWQADRYRLVSGSGDSTLKVWDLLTHQQERTITGFGKEITALDFHGGQERISAASGDASVRTYRSNDGGHERIFETTGTFQHAADLSSDGKYLVAGGEDGVVRLWQAETGAVLQTFNPQ